MLNGGRALLWDIYFKSGNIKICKIIFWFMDTSKWNMVLEKKIFWNKEWLVPLFSSSETLGQKDLRYFPDQPPLLWFHLTPALPSEVPDQKWPWWGLRWWWRGTSDWDSFWLSGEQGGSGPREGRWDEASDRWVGLSDPLKSLVFVLEKVSLSFSMPRLSAVSKYG